MKTICGKRWSVMGLRRDAPVQGAQSRTTRQEREDTVTGSRRMSRKLIAGDRHYCSRSSIGLELCKCQQGPLIRMLDAGG